MTIFGLIEFYALLRGSYQKPWSGLHFLPQSFGGEPPSIQSSTRPQRCI